MDQPLCLFADPMEKDKPTGPSDKVIYFGPGVHEPPGVPGQPPGVIPVQAGQTVYSKTSGEDWQ
eukprot:gene15267-22198_t